MHNLVKKYREELRLTQQELANRAGVSRQTILSIEKGKYDPSLRLAFKLSKILDEKIDVLFDAREDR